MPYSDPEKQRAYQTSEKRKATDKRRNLRLFNQGICRRCPKPRLASYALCASCNEKEGKRRPALSERRREILRSFYPTKFDRRQNGQPRAALAWALELYSRSA